MQHVSERLLDIATELQDVRDDEISMASEVAGQFITDHNDKAEYRRIEREANALAKAWDQMIAMLWVAHHKALAIEAKPENFYGD